MRLIFKEWFFKEGYKNYPNELDPSLLAQLDDLDKYDTIGVEPGPNGWRKRLLTGFAAIDKVDLGRSMVYIYGRNNLHDLYYDPLVGSIVTAMSKHPQTANAQVIFSDGRGERYKAGVVSNLATQRITGQYKTFARQILTNKGTPHRSKLKPFDITVIKTIQQAEWFHATRGKYINAIKVEGLKPTLESNVGWSSDNIDKQFAVYLTRNSDIANKIANSLANQYKEDAFILQVDGTAINNYSKLLIDEDAIRDPKEEKWMHAIKTKMLDKSNLPFYQSFMNLQSIAYGDVIPPQFLRVVEQIKWI
jgi:hypothetical protein